MTETVTATKFKKLRNKLRELVLDKIWTQIQLDHVDMNEENAQDYKNLVTYKKKVEKQIEETTKKLKILIKKEQSLRLLF